MKALKIYDENDKFLGTITRCTLPDCGPDDHEFDFTDATGRDDELEMLPEFLAEMIDK